MHIRYITCSDPREHNNSTDIFLLGLMPHAEIAVQCHPSKMSHGMPRNVWFQDILRQAYTVPQLNLAIHINNEWAYKICTTGKFPDELIDMVKARNEKNMPTIKRIQINMPEIAAQSIKPGAVAQLIAGMPRREFIFQYNNKTKSAVEQMHATGAKFSLLFDASGGRGVAPKSWQKPIYETHPMGYSGGISPDNVVDNLRKINELVPDNAGIWIDAEGRLKSNDLFDEKMRFDTELARQYIDRANNWQKYSR